MMNQPYTQRCQMCGQDWWDAHVCPKLTAAAPLIPSPSFTVQAGARESKPLTEADVRRIVREELAAEKEENRRKLREFIADVHGAGDDQTPG